MLTRLKRVKYKLLCPHVIVFIIVEFVLPVSFVMQRKKITFTSIHPFAMYIDFPV